MTPADTEATGSHTAGRRDALREALLQAVERTVTTEGYQALRARALAQQVGCAVGAIYNVFPDLDALVFAAKARVLDRLDDALARALTAVDVRGDVPETAIATRQLLALADAYLGFATDQAKLWRMLFEYRPAPDAPVPAWYRERLWALFAHLDEPLRCIVPDIADDKRTLLGRALFSAVHGIVALGLDEKIDTISTALIGGQVATVVRACVVGLMARSPRNEIITL